MLEIHQETGCRLCPRKCGVLREGIVTAPKRALCRASGKAEVALVSLHRWEEPCISGTQGAGTVFFSHCNLRCCFCQNHEISAEGSGVAVTDERLAEIFLEQQSRGATCLELVTPTHYVENIIRALDIARSRGFSLRVAYNTNGYDLPETIGRLKGYVDMYMPDLKYFDSRYGERYSGVPHYFETASVAIRAMFDAGGPYRVGEDGLMRSGLIVRHLVLPGLWRDSCRCLDWLWGNFGNDVCVSLMNQYMPLYKASRHPEINRKLFTLEYQKVVRHAESLGYRNCFIQIGETAESKFIPVFDGTNVLRASD